MCEDGNLQSNHNISSAKERIDNALVELIKDNQLSKITVAMITEKAGVSKSTFYRHYYDIYDVYDSLLNTMVPKCIEAMNAVIQKNNDPNVESVNVDFFKQQFLFTETDSAVFEDSVENSPTHFVEFLYQKIYSTLFDSFSLHGYGDDDVSFLAEFFSASILCCYIVNFKFENNFSIGAVKIMFDAVKKYGGKCDLLEFKKS